jgi:hypothetical protein
MSDINDILTYAWNKDAVNLKPALDNAMSDRIAAAVSDYTKDYAASMFSATTGQDDVVQEITPDLAEVQPDENV